MDDVVERLNASPALPVFVSFVHAHVEVDAVLSGCAGTRPTRWPVACRGHQLSRQHEPVASGVERSVLSSERQFQGLSSTGAARLA